MINKIFTILTRPFREHYVVDYRDSCVMYIGTFKQCKKAINVLPGGFYGILTRNQLNEEELKTL